MEKEMWEVNPEDLAGGGESPCESMEIMEDGANHYKGGEIYRKVCRMKVSRVAMENSLLVTTGKVLLELRLEESWVQQAIVWNLVATTVLVPLEVNDTMPACSFKNFANELAVHTSVRRS